MEAGAHDGVGDSQTYALEKIGWTGICVEPSSYYRALARSRRCLVDPRAMAAGEGVATFREVIGTELSGLADNFNDHWDRETRPHKDTQVRTVGLTQILREYGAPKRIEFLSLDTEGSELEILQAHDFNTYEFLFVAVEHNGVAARRDALRLLLDRAGMRFVADDGINLFMEQP